jgi:chromosomal replication initiator protein
VALGRLVSLDIQLGPDPDDLRDSLNVRRDSGLRPDFVMEHFVVSHENHMAHAAAHRVLQEPGTAYNPLFVHGPPGAGKSHLLQAICQSACAASPGDSPAASAVYIPAAEFIAQFTECFEEAVPQRFRQRFVGVHLLALDDIQVFASKTRSQEELFHVVNTILTAGRQLILSADRPPAAIAGLEPRLVSRFSAGLVLAMDPPGIETRMRIIEQKDRSGCFEFPQDTLQQIARRCAPRDLDRVLSRLDELAQSHGGQVTVDLVDEVFRDQQREAVNA